jgi:hypothetical protein
VKKKAARPENPNVTPQVLMWERQVKPERPGDAAGRSGELNCFEFHPTMRLRSAEPLNGLLEVPCDGQSPANSKSPEYGSGALAHGGAVDRDGGAIFELLGFAASDVELTAGVGEFVIESRWEETVFEREQGSCEFDGTSTGVEVTDVAFERR